MGWLVVAMVLAAADDDETMLTLDSPDGRIKVNVAVDGADRRPSFGVTFRDVPVVSGRLGLAFAGSGPLCNGLHLVGERVKSHDAVYAIAVGKASSARDRHNRIVAAFHEEEGERRQLAVEFRAFDDGLAFRYAIPRQPKLQEFVLTDELTELTFVGAPRATLLPLKSYTTPYEWYYDDLSVTQARPGQLIGLPMLLRRPQQAFVAVTEAGLTDYAGMYMTAVEGRPGVFASKLSPLPGRTDAKVVGRCDPWFISPWRVLMIGDSPGRLIESNIIFNLNEPCKIADTSWIKPGKTTFTWWNHFTLDNVDFKPGMNTATMLHYIDFCAEHHIPCHTIDGLDTAWYGGPIQPKGPTDVTKPSAELDLPKVLAHAKAKGVGLRVWVHFKALWPMIDQAFATYERWGLSGVMVDFMDRDDQEMVGMYHAMAEKAAQHHLTINFHGAYKPTGMERTWPNVLNYEAALNQEFNKWQPKGTRGTPPSHNLDIAFVRMLAGPLDYHQGGMRNVLPADYKFRDVAPPVQGTRGHQLAMYVVYQNHLPMLADSPSAYRGQPGFDFMCEVPCNWDETRVLHAELGKCLVIARRQGNTWWLGGMTAEEPRRLDLDVSSLAPRGGDAKLYLDDAAKGPTALTIASTPLAAGAPLRVAMPASGGFAARLALSAP